MKCNAHSESLRANWVASVAQPLLAVWFCRPHGRRPIRPRLQNPHSQEWLCYKILRETIWLFSTKKDTIDWPNWNASGLRLQPVTKMPMIPLHLQPESHVPLYIQLRDQIRA